MNYRWLGASFEIDDGLEDESYLQFHKLEGDQVTASLTAAAEDTEVPLPAFVAADLTELKVQMDGWSIAEDPVVDEQLGLVELSGPGELYMVRSFRRANEKIFFFTATGAKSARPSLMKWAKNAAESLKQSG